MQDVIVEGVGIPSAIPNQNEVGAIITGHAPEDKVEALREIAVFADLPEDQLRWFADQTEERRLATGEVLFRKGDPPNWMAIYLEGEMHAYRNDDQHDGYVYIARAGDPASQVSGMLPFSRMTNFSATGRAVMPTRMLLFPVQKFPEMLQRMPVLAQRLVGIMSDRVRETTKADQQRDKLMALGKLSAGLAHELNNPAAAATRAANDLLCTLEELRAADLRLCRHDLGPEQRAAIAEFEKAAIEHEANAQPMNSLALSDLEDEVNTWIEKRGLEEGWNLAATLVEAGVKAEALELLANKIEAHALGDVLTRIVAQLSAAKLTGEIKNSTARISELVGAIKEYTYMDQAAVQQVDLHKGLENTLVILKHKLKKKNIKVVREYAPEMPLIKAAGSELNQVWTNLIDNAIDAMSEGGTLKVRTRQEPTDVMIEIRDNGAGIPDEMRARIFEPFFTTKGVGEGTGLGLDTVSHIVRKHRGNIRFESKPGDTCFQVRLPLNSN